MLVSSFGKKQSSFDQGPLTFMSWNRNLSPPGRLLPLSGRIMLHQSSPQWVTSVTSISVCWTAFTFCWWFNANCNPKFRFKRQHQNLKGPGRSKGQNKHVTDLNHLTVYSFTLVEPDTQPWSTSSYTQIVEPHYLITWLHSGRIHDHLKFNQGCCRLRADGW